jgi:hypothetical protein
MLLVLVVLKKLLFDKLNRIVLPPAALSVQIQAPQAIQVHLIPQAARTTKEQAPVKKAVTRVANHRAATAARKVIIPMAAAAMARAAITITTHKVAVLV